MKFDIRDFYIKKEKTLLEAANSNKINKFLDSNNEPN
jgi:hypothetical protein